MENFSFCAVHDDKSFFQFRNFFSGQMGQYLVINLHLLFQICHQNFQQIGQQRPDFHQLYISSTRVKNFISIQQYPDFSSLSSQISVCAHSSTQNKSYQEPAHSLFLRQQPCSFRIFIINIVPYFLQNHHQILQFYNNFCHVLKLLANNSISTTLLNEKYQGKKSRWNG